MKVTREIDSHIRIH